GELYVALADPLSGIAGSSWNVRIGSLNERDRAVLPPRRRVGASSQEEVLACVVVHPQRGSSENVAVGDPLLRERLFLVDRPQLLPGAVGDDVAVARPDSDRRERADHRARDGRAELAPAALRREETVSPHDGS